MKYLFFIAVNILWTMVWCQNEIDSSYLYELSINEECAFKMKIPNNIDYIDSLVINEYGIIDDRNYMFYINILSELDYKIYFLNLKINNEEICIDNTLIRIKLYNLTECIKIEEIKCPVYPLTYFIPLKLE